MQGFFEELETIEASVRDTGTELKMILGKLNF